MVKPRRLLTAVTALLSMTLVVAGCGDSSTGGGEPVSTPSTGNPPSTTAADPAPTRPTRFVDVELTLVTHDSFSLSPALLESFEDETGIKVQVLPSGDAGGMVNRAILTKDDPEGDVLFGVDNTLLERAINADLFLDYESDLLSHVPDALEVDSRVTPIDRGWVCINYDKAWFADSTLDPPASLDDLVDPDYRDLTVVEDPTTSSPGLAFLLATHAQFGEGWKDWWSSLRDNGVRVESGWESAYYSAFSGGSGEGDRPIVVSYASSPAAEVYFSDPAPAEAPTGVLTDGCFEQVEYAGVLAGTENELAAQVLVDFLLSPQVQEDIPLQMFVYPVRPDVELPHVFVENAVEVEDPIAIDPGTAAGLVEELPEQWVEVVLR